MGPSNTRRQSASYIQELASRVWERGRIDTAYHRGVVPYLNENIPNDVAQVDAVSGEFTLSTCAMNALGRGQYLVKWKNDNRQKHKIEINHISKWVLENTCMDKDVGLILQSQGLPLTRRNLVTMTRQLFSKPIIDIMVNQDMTGVLFNLMAIISMIGLENGCLVMVTKSLLVSGKPCDCKIRPASLSIQVFSDTQ